MFKKILSLSTIFILASSTNAATKVEKCENVLTAGVYNGYLEEICGFDGGVSDKLKVAYSSQNCPNLVSEKRIYSLVGDVTLDTKNRYVAFGEEKFCEANIEGYADLSIALKKGIDMFNQDLFKQKGN